MLELLSENQISIPEIGTVRATEPPLVIITSNRTREIHDALKRRCLYHWVDFPAAERELEIVQRKMPEIDEQLSRLLVNFVQRLRQEDLFKLPGIAETLDWADALVQLDQIALDPTTIDGTLGTLLKYQDDIAKIRGSEAARILEEVKLQFPCLSLAVAKMSGRSALPFLQGSLAENIMLFARLLRATGMPVGTGSVLNAIRAVSLIGIESQQDLHTVLLCQFVSRREQMPVFDQTFALFWRNPKLMEKLMGAMLPTLQSDQDQQPLIRRLGEALSSSNTQSSGQDEEQVELQANLSASESEILQSRDFEQMSESELQMAIKMLKTLKLPVQQIQSLRHQASVSRAHIDMRRTMQNSLRNSELIPLQFKRQITRPPAIIVLCDISGSMAQYSRMFLHFMHAMTNNGDGSTAFYSGLA